MDDEQAHELQRDRERASLDALTNCFIDGAAESDVMELASAVGVSALLKPELARIKMAMSELQLITRN